MALIRGWRFLDSARINNIVRVLADELENRQPLVFLERTPVVDADDDEIVGKFKGQFFAADIVADDQEAVVYDTVGRFEFVANNIPNLKMGSRVSQSMINRLNRVRRNLGTQQDIRFLTDWENTLGETLITGVRQRMNALIAAMLIDDGAYDRLGIKLAGASWGTPADLKVTLTGNDRWSTDGGATANAHADFTPITDLQVMIQEIAPDVHGEMYNRITMSSKTFRFVTSSAEFQKRISGELRYSFGAGELNVRDTGMMRQLLANIIGAEIELYDGTYWERNNAGVRSRVRVLPANKVLFSNSADDMNGQAYDFANGIVTESVVAGLSSNHNGVGGEAFGPIAYYTADENLNPPDIKAWAVARGFPRKHRETCTAVYTVW